MNNTKSSLQHTAKYLLAWAIKQFALEAKLVSGGVISTQGFYYDVDFHSQTITISDLRAIKAIMQRAINQNLAFTFTSWPVAKTKKYFLNHKYKQQILAPNHNSSCQLIGEKENYFDLYYQEPLTPLKEIQHWQLTNISAAYWLNDPTKPRLTRISGVVFPNQQGFDTYLADLADQQANNHRTLGKKLAIFTFDPLIGPGLPIWLENGWIIKDLIIKFINQIQIAHGIELVATPVLATKTLYQTSGHWDHYQENIFPPIKLDNHQPEMVLRPMTCPHHIILFKKQSWSYKQLPKIYGENALLYRYEHSGGLLGLERVRAMELIDTHAFVRDDQIESFVATAYQMIKTAMEGFDLKISRIDLSLRDPNNPTKFFPDDLFWLQGEGQLRKILTNLKLTYHEIIGEAAFYGPKIDFQITTISQKLLTVATIQLDYLLPQKFNLTYWDQANQPRQPILIHVGIIGTLERFIALYLEQKKGVFPFWLAPVQIIIIPINHHHLTYCQQLVEELKGTSLQLTKNLQKQLKWARLRIKIDDSNERLSKKIRNAQTQKIPYQIIVGDQEVSQPTIISYRQYGHKQTTKTSKKTFYQTLCNLLFSNHFIN